jgi:hypothetical protein
LVEAIRKNNLKRNEGQVKHQGSQETVELPGSGIIFGSLHHLAVRTSEINSAHAYKTLRAASQEDQF